MDMFVKYSFPLLHLLHTLCCIISTKYHYMKFPPDWKKSCVLGCHYMHYVNLAILVLAFTQQWIQQLFEDTFSVWVHHWLGCLTRRGKDCPPKGAQHNGGDLQVTNVQFALLSVNSEWSFSLSIKLIHRAGGQEHPNRSAAVTALT